MHTSRMFIMLVHNTQIRLQTYPQKLNLKISTFELDPRMFKIDYLEKWSMMKQNLIFHVNLSFNKEYSEYSLRSHDELQNNLYVNKNYFHFS